MRKESNQWNFLCALTAVVAEASSAPEVRTADHGDGSVSEEKQTKL